MDISQQQIARTSVSGTFGVVAGKMPVAVDAGKRMLEQGGNAIDAAVAMAFAMGVAEPWMNGIGGGGYMVVWLAAEQRSLVIEYPMIAPSGATEDMFPLGTGTPDAANFGWRPVVGSENIVGYKAVGVPGTVAGLCHALIHYGTLPLATVLAPAIEIAEEGILVNWHTTLRIANDLENLQRFPATAATFLRNGQFPPTNTLYGGNVRIPFPDLARTLRRIAEEGPDAIYNGSLTDTIVNHLAENGTPITRTDFENYRPTEDSGLTVDIADHKIHLVGKGTGGTSIAQALKAANHLDLPALGHNTVESSHALTQVFRQTFADRFAYLADPDFVDIPLEAMLSDDHARQTAASVDFVSAVRPQHAPFDVTHNLTPSLPDYTRDGSTTHLGVIDAAGNAVSLTQTLLSLWGSRVTIPGVGMLMNNGMMWFDPEPGHPNSPAPGKRPLANMAPLVVTRDNQIVASIGSSGGRKILNCNTQILLNHIVHDQDIHQALEAPRLDASTRALNVSSRFDPLVVQGLREIGHEVVTVDETRLTGEFASPVAISRSSSGTVQGAVDPWYYPATAIGLDKE